MIRKARVADADALAGLITQLGYPTATSAMRERLRTLAGPDRETLVFELGGRVAGMIGLMRHRYYERDGFGVQVAALVVAGSDRKRGIGRALLDAGEAWGRAHDCDTVWLNSAKRRRDAHRFYRRAGYADTGLRFVKEL